VTVTATITDDGVIVTATLFYSVAGSSFVEVPMALQAGDEYAAQIPPQADGSQVAYYILAGDDNGLTATDPANAPGDTHTYLVGYQPPILFINEFMADNDAVVEDPDEPGEHPDWIELYNPGTEAVDLQGLYLTDDLADPTQHQIAQTLVISAGGFVLLYADGDPEQGAAHLDFKLGASGEEIGLFAADGVTTIDSYTFGPQTTDISEGRCPDGGDAWTTFADATPGAANDCAGEDSYRIYLPLIVRE